MLSDFSTLTDLREIFASTSSVMAFSLRASGVRERRLEEDDDDDLVEMLATSLLRLERDLLGTGGGDGELRLLCERGERARCDFLLRSRDLERLPLPLLMETAALLPPSPPPPTPCDRERRERDVLRRWRDRERLPRDLDERECLPPRERDRRERELLRRWRERERLLRDRDECLPRERERRDLETLRRSRVPERRRRRELER